MGKKQYPREISPQPTEHCGYSSAFHEVSEHFEDDVEKFLRFIERMIQHVMKAQCQECEDELVRGYQIPPGCNNAALGHEVSLHPGVFTDHEHLNLTDALTVMRIDYPELAKEIEHVRECFGCALAVANERDKSEHKE